MKNKIKLFVAAMMAFVYASMPVAVMAGAHNFAQSSDGVNTAQIACDVIDNIFDDGGDCQDPDEADEQIYRIVRTILNVFSIIIAALAVIMIIVGGFRYITSGGDSNGVQAAKNTILYAIVGLVIVLFAQIIVQFVIARLTPDQS